MTARVRPTKATAKTAPPVPPDDQVEGPVLRMSAPAAAPPDPEATRVEPEIVPDAPAQEPLGRVRVRVVVGHDGRRRGQQLDLDLTGKEQQLIDRGYLQLIGTLDPTVPPFVATYPPTR